MRFSLSLRAANSPSRLVYALDRLLSRVEAGVHDLSFEDIEAIEETVWFRMARAHVQYLIRLLCEAQVWSGAAARPHVTIAEPEEIVEACDAAMNPLRIVVENDASDGALVRAAILAFADPRAMETWLAGKAAVPPGWKFENGGGGGEIPRIVREQGDHKLPGGPRVLVVCDSDRTVPSDADSPKVKGYAEATRQIGARDPVVLPLREAENYLPDAFWRGWLMEDRGRTSYGPVIEALVSLSPQQRDFIDMKGDNRLLKNELGLLFDGSSPDNPRPAPQHLRALAGRPHDLKGSGHDPTTKKSRMTIRQLPEMVQAGKVRREDLEQRDREGVLFNLVRLIEEEL